MLHATIYLLLCGAGFPAVDFRVSSPFHAAFLFDSKTFLPLRLSAIDSYIDELKLEAKSNNLESSLLGFLGNSNQCLVGTSRIFGVLDVAADVQNINTAENKLGNILAVHTAVPANLE